MKYFLKAKLIFLALNLLTLNAFAESADYKGFSAAFGKSSQPGEKSISTGLAILKSTRLTESYGYEMQFGLFDNSGPYTSNAFVDLSAIGLLPLNENGLKFYGKAGLADVYSRGEFGSANSFGLTYGAGVEFTREVGIIRVGLQHFSLGRGGLNSSLSTNLIELSLFLK